MQISSLPQHADEITRHKSAATEVVASADKSLFPDRITRPALKRPRSSYDVIIVGGGFYGCCVAISLGEQGYSVLLLEKESGLLTRASYVNQARVHNGYHYPRSMITALRAAVNFPRFVQDFKGCIDKSFEKIYAIAKTDSKVNSSQFAMFCKRIGVPIHRADPKLKALFSKKLIEDVFSVEEYAFDATLLACEIETRLEQSHVEVRRNLEVVKVEAAMGNAAIAYVSDGMAVRASHVFNCTYSQINSLLRASQVTPLQMKHEITELTLIDPPSELRGYGITIMDGPFFSTMPFPSRHLHSFSHVRYTPHVSWFDAETSRNPHQYLKRLSLEPRFPLMIRDAERYLPVMRDAVYRDSLYEVKTVLFGNEIDDGRPILFRTHPDAPMMTSIMGAKIDNVFDVIEALQLANLVSASTVARVEHCQEN